MKEFEAECQCALSTRAGTSGICFELHPSSPEATVLSVDSKGAFDHVHRAVMLSRLMQMPQARSFLPFVRLSYGCPSQYTWQDDSGQDHTVVQAEGGDRVTL